ncbi:MAG: hypothetical protein KIS81_06550 [Maricaulaceae bacterium]|nr:hypothetical protein [Maricaulaceae bacterium]
MRTGLALAGLAFIVIPLFVAHGFWNFGDPPAVAQFASAREAVVERTDIAVVNAGRGWREVRVHVRPAEPEAFEPGWFATPRPGAASAAQAEQTAALFPAGRQVRVIVHNGRLYEARWRWGYTAAWAATVLALVVAVTGLAGVVLSALAARRR